MGGNVSRATSNQNCHAAKRPKPLCAIRNSLHASPSPCRTCTVLRTIRLPRNRELPPNLPSCWQACKNATWQNVSCGPQSSTIGGESSQRVRAPRKLTCQRAVSESASGRVAVGAEGRGEEGANADRPALHVELHGRRHEGKALRGEGVHDELQVDRVPPHLRCAAKHGHA